jgi:uncharacterized protein
VSLAFAYDRSTSSRWIDADGRLHATANLTRGCVNDYLGSEIPDAARYGLAPAATYRLFRDPNELAKAAPSFDNLPVLAEHYIVTSTDPQQGLVVGATGSDSEFDPPFLRNSLVIWVQSAIDDIVSGRKRELSCGYRFSLDMSPGIYVGEAYDARMVNIEGSHVALVPDGRVGSSCAIDAEPRPAWLSRQEDALGAFRRRFCVA